MEKTREAPKLLYADLNNKVRYCSLFAKIIQESVSEDKERALKKNASNKLRVIDETCDADKINSDGNHVGMIGSTVNSPQTQSKGSEDTDPNKSRAMTSKSPRIKLFRISAKEIQSKLDRKTRQRIVPPDDERRSPPLVRTKEGNQKHPEHELETNISQNPPIPSSVSSSEQNNQCDVCCRKVFEERKPIHIRPEDRLKCNFCTGSYKDIPTLVEHIETSHPTQRVEEQDVIYITPEELLKCNLCTRMFKNITTLAEHIRRLHPGVNKTFKLRNSPCPSHICTHTRKATKQSFKFNTCQVFFSRIESLKSHNFTNHSTAPKPKLFECDICNARFLSSTSLDRHIQNGIHPMARYFQCKVVLKRLCEKSKSQLT